MMEYTIEYILNKIGRMKSILPTLDELAEFFDPPSTGELFAPEFGIARSYIRRNMRPERFVVYCGLSTFIQKRFLR